MTPPVSALTLRWACNAAGRVSLCRFYACHCLAGYQHNESYCEIFHVCDPVGFFRIECNSPPGKNAWVQTMVECPV